MSVELGLQNPTQMWNDLHLTFFIELGLPQYFNIADKRHNPKIREIFFPESQNKV